MSESNQSEMKDEQTNAGQTERPPMPGSEHFRQARIEFLKGVRELLDYRIEKLSQTAQKG